MRFTTIGVLTFAILLAGTMIASSNAAAADAKDPLTGLPRHTGMSFQQEVDSQFAGKTQKWILRHSRECKSGGVRGLVQTS